jgi:hypothetical protein
MLDSYESTLVRHAVAINEHIVACFARSPFFLEVKLYILERFLETMDYQ